MAAALGIGGGAAGAEAAVEQWLAAGWAPRRLLRTDSGTSALRLAIEAAIAVTGEKRVAAPAYVCYDVATALDGAGAVPVLYDLDPAGLGPDPDSLRRAFELGARTVIAVHLYGVPVDMPGIVALARSYGALVVEDAAQAIGARQSGTPAGASGDLGVLSFGRGKGVTGGGGGALLIYDESAGAVLPPALSPGGGTARSRLVLLAQGVLASPSLYWMPVLLPGTGLGETVYHPPWPPAGQSHFSTAVLALTMVGAESERKVRVANAEGFLQRLEGHARLGTVRPAANAQPSWLRFPVLDRTAGPARFDASARRLGIMPGYPRSLADLPGFGARVANAADPFPGARLLAARLGTLPTHSLLAPRDLQALSRWLDRHR